MSTFADTSITTDRFGTCIDASNPKSYSGSGNTWIDLINQTENFTLSNTPIYTTATTTTPGYFSFSNTDTSFANTVLTNTTFGSQGTTNTSIEIVFRFTSPPPANTYWYICNTKTDAGIDGYQIWYNYNPGNGKYYLNSYRWAAGSGVVLSSSFNYDWLGNTWHHIIMSASLENGITFRLDGGGNLSPFNGYGAGPVNKGNYHRLMYLGCSGPANQSSSYPTTGQYDYTNIDIALVRLYNKELNDFEAKNNYLSIRNKFNITGYPTF